MKKLYLSIILLVVSVNSFAQYRIDIKCKIDRTVYLTFYGQKQFVIFDYKDFTGDGDVVVTDTYIFSCGSYSEHEDTLILRDNFLGYRMKFLKTGNKLKTIKGMKWMYDEQFERFEIKIAGFSDEEDKLIKAYKSFNSNTPFFSSMYNKLYLGSYYSKYYYDRLIFTSPNKYTLLIGELEMTSGTFKYTGKQIIFSDKNLGLVFRGRVEEKGVELNLPQFQNETFTR